MDRGCVDSTAPLARRPAGGYRLPARAEPANEAVSRNAGFPLTPPRHGRKIWWLAGQRPQHVGKQGTTLWENGGSRPPSAAPPTRHSNSASVAPAARTYRGQPRAPPSPLRRPVGGAASGRRQRSADAP